MSRRQIELAIKRACDVLISGATLLIMAPLLLLLALWIRVDSGGPALFSQWRAGKDGRPFRILKFRTMVEHAESMGPGLTTAQNDPRITRVGRTLRRLSLDEVPQLINVLTGSMSLVGPRPAPLEHFASSSRRRLALRPGITGWAQINGRNRLTWPERVALDLWYVDNFSLLWDLKILLRTFSVVLTREGVYSGRNDEKVKSTSYAREEPET